MKREGGTGIGEWWSGILGGRVFGWEETEGKLLSGFFWLNSKEFFGEFFG